MTKEQVIDKAQAFMAGNGSKEVYATSDGNLFEQKHYANAWAGTKKLEVYHVKAKPPKKEALPKEEPKSEVVEKPKTKTRRRSKK